MRDLVSRNAVAYRPGVITNTLLEAWLVRRPKPRIGSGFLVRWLAVATFCYLLSGQALGTRDQLGTSLGWHVYAELSLFLASVTIAWAVWAIHGVSPRPSNSLWLFLALGLLALFSSVRSFWPPLSIVKGCMFCLVLLLAELLCNTFSSAAILRATYYGIVSVFSVAILIGLALPDTYPLRVIDESGSQRLALFTYIHGDLAYMAGLGVFIGRLPAVRARWYFQAFLAGLTVAGGSRVCACALKAQRGLARDQGQAVGEGKHDEVILLSGVLEELTAIGDVNADPRVLVRLVGMVVETDLVELGIDLHRVNVLGAVSQSNSDVVAVAGADDEDVVERVARTGVLVRPLAVAVYLVRIVEDIGSALVGDPVDRDGDVGR